MDICQSEKDGDLQAKLQAIKTAEEEDFGHSYIGQVSKLSNITTYLLCGAMAVLNAKARSWLWQTMEYPHTSSLAQVLAWFSLSMVLVSTFTFIVSTADILQSVQGSFENVTFTICSLISIISHHMTCHTSEMQIMITGIIKIKNSNCLLGSIVVKKYTILDDDDADNEGFKEN